MGEDVSLREEGRWKIDVIIEGEIAKAAQWAIRMPARIQLDTAQENDWQADRQTQQTAQETARECSCTGLR